MSIIEDFRNILERERNAGHSLNKLVTEAGVEYASVYKWLNSKQKSLNLNTVARILDTLGARIVLPAHDAAREVCFVDAKLVPAAGGNCPPPDAEDYLAVPVVEEVGAGPGILPLGETKSWFLVYKHQPAVRYRRDLIAVEIGKHSTSMLPTLSPGDIVLVDRQDRDVMRPGRMMLVMDPEGAGKIKRVASEDRKQDFRITYYSDNAADNPPEVYSLREDFGDDWEKCIVGRVVWAWSDVSDR